MGKEGPPSPDSRGCHVQPAVFRNVQPLRSLIRGCFLMIKSDSCETIWLLFTVGLGFQCFLSPHLQNCLSPSASVGFLFPRCYCWWGVLEQMDRLGHQQEEGWGRCGWASGQSRGQGQDSCKWHGNKGPPLGLSSKHATLVLGADGMPQAEVIQRLFPLKISWEDINALFASLFQDLFLLNLGMLSTCCP